MLELPPPFITYAKSHKSKPHEVQNEILIIFVYSLPQLTYFSFLLGSEQQRYEERFVYSCPCDTNRYCSPYSFMWLRPAQLGISIVLHMSFVFSPVLSGLRSRVQLVLELYLKLSSYSSWAWYKGILFFPLNTFCALFVLDSNSLFQVVCL